MRCGQRASRPLRSREAATDRNCPWWPLRGLWRPFWRSARGVKNGGLRRMARSNPSLSAKSISRPLWAASSFWGSPCYELTKATAADFRAETGFFPRAQCTPVWVSGQAEQRGSQPVLKGFWRLREWRGRLPRRLSISSGCSQLWTSVHGVPHRNRLPERGPGWGQPLASGSSLVLKGAIRKSRSDPVSEKGPHFSRELRP